MTVCVLKYWYELITRPPVGLPRGWRWTLDSTSLLNRQDGSRRVSVPAQSVHVGRFRWHRGAQQLETKLAQSLLRSGYQAVGTVLRLVSIKLILLLDTQPRICTNVAIPYPLFCQVQDSKLDIWNRLLWIFWDIELATKLCSFQLCNSPIRFKNEAIRIVNIASGLMYFQHNIQYVCGRLPVISSMSSANLRSPYT